MFVVFGMHSWNKEMAIGVELEPWNPFFDNVLQSEGDFHTLMVKLLKDKRIWDESMKHSNRSGDGDGGKRRREEKKALRIRGFHAKL